MVSAEEFREKQANIFAMQTFGTMWPAMIQPLLIKSTSIVTSLLLRHVPRTSPNLLHNHVFLPHL